MAKAKKITKKELESIKDVQQKTNAILLDVGYLEAQKTGLMGAHAQASKELQVIKTELEEKYGQVNVDLKDGSYTVIETPDVEEVKEMEVVK
jgi:hypothetical protein|tara:strand:- start:1497 stop:1772 length:276 start_codon:yes stop_codon:yes gene_type:complete